MGRQVPIFSVYSPSTEHTAAMGNATGRIPIPMAAYRPKDLINHVPAAFGQKPSSADLYRIARGDQFCYNPIAIPPACSILRDDAVPGYLM